MLDALADLRRRFDVVIFEGAGSPAEINLLDHDIVNLRVADEPACPPSSSATSTGAACSPSLYGTVALLPDGTAGSCAASSSTSSAATRRCSATACASSKRAAGVPTLGVLPWLHDVALDAEDSLALAGPRPRRRGAGARRRARRRRRPLPPPLELHRPRRARHRARRARALRRRAAALGRPDLVVLPGTKATVADLDWLREPGLDRAIVGADRRGSSSGSAAATRCSGARSPTRSSRAAGDVAGLGGSTSTRCSSRPR